MSDRGVRACLLPPGQRVMIKPHVEALVAYIQFLGAAGTVTGSKHLINTSGDEKGHGGTQVLIDCGLFQGQKQWRERNWQGLPLAARTIEAVILTHAHLDHCGWIPRLVKQGFRGAIYATPATIDLCSILLPDSGHLQEEDAAFHNRHRTSRHHPALPLYTAEEARSCLKLFQPVEFGEIKHVSPDLSFRFVRAAHILGSAMAEITLEGKGRDGRPMHLLFTGDVGRIRDQNVAPGKVVYSGPETGESADVLVVESTYGNRQHPTEDPQAELAALIQSTVERGGSLIVPAFAVERTQKFLFMLKELMESGQSPRVPVYCDSPMAIRAVEIFLKYAEQYSESTRQLIGRYGSPLFWPGFTFAERAEDSKKINQSRLPSIIISSSGMVSGGRIQHHLLERMPDPKNTILFIGFQAPGTRGFTIKSGASEIKMLGQQVPIRARVAALEQFSDHADRRELLEWLPTFHSPPVVTYLVHGEPEAAAGLRQAMIEGLGWKVEIAAWMQKLELAVVARAMPV